MAQELICGICKKPIIPSEFVCVMSEREMILVSVNHFQKHLLLDAFYDDVTGDATVKAEISEKLTDYGVYGAVDICKIFERSGVCKCMEDEKEGEEKEMGSCNDVKDILEELGVECQVLQQADEIAAEWKSTDGLLCCYSDPYNPLSKPYLTVNSVTPEQAVRMTVGDVDILPNLEANDFEEDRDEGEPRFFKTFYLHGKDVLKIHRYLQDLLPSDKWHNINIFNCGWSNAPDCWHLEAMLTAEENRTFVDWLKADPEIELYNPALIY